MASLVLKPMIPKLDFIPNVIAVSTYTRNVINKLVWNFLFSTNEVIYHFGPLHTQEEGESVCMIKPLLFPPTPKKMSWPKNNSFFSFANSSLIPPFFL